MPWLALLALVVLAASPAAARGLTEAQVRAALAAQGRAWDAGRLEGYAPDAVFVDQARAGDGRLVPYGRSTLAEARAQARKAFARSRVRETRSVVGVAIAPDGRSAATRSRVVSRIETGGATRTVCVERTQTLALSGGRLLSKGQTDTVVRCPHPPAPRSASAATSPG